MERNIKFMNKIYDECSFNDNTLKREIIFKRNDNKLIKIKVKRNCNNYESNIMVSLLDVEQINEIELLFKESDMLINKNLNCYNDNEKEIIIAKNNEDIEKILKELERIGV